MVPFVGPSFLHSLLANGKFSASLFLCGAFQCPSSVYLEVRGTLNPTIAVLITQL